MRQQGIDKDCADACQPVVDRVIVIICACFGLTGCAVSGNPAAYLNDKRQAEMLKNLVQVDQNGYRSIGTALMWPGYSPAFLGDKTTDLSMLVYMPYMTEDGVNEKGFAVKRMTLNGCCFE